MMLPETAIELIATICYKPGWKLEATDYSNRFEASICLKVTYPAPETGRENWARGYTEMIEPRASFPIQIHDCDAQGLFRKVLDALLVIEVHEAREIMRVRPTGWAPFHPHTVDGMQRWGEPHRDLAFGLV